MAQAKRSIKIAFPGGTAPQSIESDATTWGALKAELKNQLDQSFSNQKVRDYTTNHHYADDNAVMPKGDIKLLVSTDKNKSGMPTTKANYHKVGFSELRTFAKKVLGKSPNGKQACIDALNKHYGKDAVKEVKAKTSGKKTAAPKKEKAEKAEATASETATPGKKSSEKASGGKLEARVAALEKRMDTLFGKDDEDAGFAKAASNLK